MVDQGRPIHHGIEIPRLLGHYPKIYQLFSLSQAGAPSLLETDHFFPYNERKKRGFP